MQPEIKLAQTLDGVHELIRRRWSPRAFADRPVSESDLALLFEAARWAPSSFNEQPWRFLVTRRSTQDHQKLLDCLVPGNQLWAATAPVLMLTTAKRTFSHNGAPNHHALHDTGMALAFLMLQATELEIFVHAMAGFDHDKARAAFAISDDFAMGAAVALGYLGDPASLAAKFLQSELAPRARKPLSEIVEFR